ncbi:hypothetical protein [Leptotrichia wadei]|uniref:hypothetical protein n=1 Tax=Leptotrichia wadei TaxID=157687 RepID=UPI0028E1AACD|nr:hypothetical protein [Leptotrichia wadei]
MIINIYDKNNLQVVAHPVVTNLEDFKDNPIMFYPDWDSTRHVYSDIEYQNPILISGNMREMSKEELYAIGKYTLADNELVENNKIKAVELSEFEYIENNTVKLNRKLKIEQIKKELSDLKVEYSEKEFLFKGKYLQKNREKGDRDSLTSLILLLTITGRKETSEWKLIDKDTREHVYPTLTLDDFKLMAFHMQSQLSKALKTESEIISRLKTLLDEELKIFNAKEEFEKLWN